MLQFVSSLFGCAHRRCTFPITARNSARASLAGKPSAGTYIVCLDCGKEFAYDWQKMKRVGRPVLTPPAQATPSADVHVA